MTPRPAIQDLIRSNVTIPTLPEIVIRIGELVEDPDSGTAEIGSLVSEDAPLAAKVLRIANSAYYGLSGQCVSTEQASTVLGVRVLKNIVTQAAVINQFEHLEGNDVFSISDLWKHAAFTGHVCQKIARQTKAMTLLAPEEFYVCGLLHDVGKVVMLDGLGEHYLELVRRSKEQGKPLHAVERGVLSFNHTDVGALVATRWDLPQKLVNAIQYHHGPREHVARDSVVSTVAHANLLVHRIDDGSQEGIDAVFDAETRELLGLTQADVAAIVEFAHEKRGASL